MGPSPAVSPRTLTQMLRELDAPALTQLLMDRPDLAVPTPTGFAELASRATTRHSITLALQRLTAFEVWVAGMASVSRAFQPAELVVEGVDLADVAHACGRLRSLALVWGDAAALRPVRALSNVFEKTVSGSEPLGQSAPPTHPPTFIDAERREPTLVTSAAAGSAFELVRRMDCLVEHCDHQPLRLRRDGGPATRDLRLLAEMLDVRSAAAVTHLEIARTAGLLGVSSDERDEILVPTAVFDSWQGQELQAQWVDLVEAWFERQPSTGLGWVKRLAFGAFGSPEAGRVLTPADVRSWLDWQRPRRPGRTDRQAADLLEQASWLGLTGLGALAAYAVPPDASGLAALLPERVEHVVVQADFTAIAPGPLTPAAAHDLGTLADVESRGGATVYRFSTESLQRARALGWDSETILATLQSRSRTPLPQPLHYLVRDLDRLKAPPAADGTWDDTHRHRQPLRASGHVPEQLAADSYPDAAEVARVVEVLLTKEVDPPPSTDAATGSSWGDVFDSPLGALREAVETSEVVWCGYVDKAGRRTERLFKIASVEEGLVEARDAKTDESMQLPLRRITAAHILRPGA